MAIRKKTVQYAFPELAAITDNTDTDFTQITIYLPEDSITFRSVVLDVMYQDASNPVGNDSRRQVSLQLGAAGYDTVNNTNALNQSGETSWKQMTGDFTSTFASDWTGTSMTCDARILVNNASASPDLRSGTAVLTITYDYDEDSATHIKTAWLPIPCPVSAALGTSKPGAATATIPALDTWLPEASKTIRQTSIVVQGNENQSGTTDSSLNMELDSAGAHATATHGAWSNCTRWLREIWQPSFDTSATHDFYLWADKTLSYAGLQAWMIITYEFDPDATTTVLNSLWLPMEFDSPAGGTTSGDYQKANRQLYIEEPGTIMLRESALLLFFDAAAAIAGANARVNGGSWIGYNSRAAQVAGGLSAMLDATGDLPALARGSNAFDADVYRTDGADLMMNLSSVWILNYTSGKHPNGVGVHNHSVCRNFFTHGTVAADNNRITPAFAPAIASSEYFLNAVGVNYQYLTHAGANAGGVAVQAERLVGEGGVKWESIYGDIGHTDPEVGVRQIWANARKVFRRWPGDPDPERLDLETARRYKAVLAVGANSFDHLDMWATYHSITFEVSGTITGYDGDGSGIAVCIHRADTGEKVLEAITAVGGGFSATWYDDTEDLYAVARQDDTHIGRSADAVAV